MAVNTADTLFPSLHLGPGQTVDASAKMLYGILDYIYNPIVAVDAQGRITFCNRAMAAKLQHSLDEVLGQRVEDFVHYSRLRQIIETGRTESVQKIDIGGTVYMSNRTAVMDQGKVIGAVAVLQDISELAAIADELEQTKRLTVELDAIIESSFDGIYVTDGRGRTIRVNKAYERITGIRRQDVLGRKMDDLVAEGFFSESATLRVLESKHPESLMQTVKTGKRVMVTGTPIVGDDGEVTLVVTSVRDVTELYNLQNQLVKEETLRSKYESELEKLRRTAGSDGEVIIQSKKMRQTHELALRLAQVDTTILVQGESGVGKEVFADLVHSHSQRRDKPLIKISCAAIPEQLLESELFGYAPAAFTGASKQGKVGIFESARGGTIFLDEIGEMPLPLQAKLLRVLQTKEVTRVGSSVAVPVDVRIVAATNRDLKQMVAKGQYRSDLFFRLNVVPVVIPPLRERKEAIPNLVYHFLEKYNRQYGFSKQLEPQVLEELYGYDWPGNVRELVNTIERLVVTTSGDVISAADLPERMRGAGQDLQTMDIVDGSLKATLDNVERRIIAEALEKHGSTRGAAKALGVNQSTIVRKMQRLGLVNGNGGSL